MTELFRNADVLVRLCGGFSQEQCVVTFASFTNDQRVDRPGFAEDFLAGEGIDAIHVITRDNRWYDYPAIGKVLEAIRHSAVGYARIATYGSSMGGFAALHFAGHVGAQTAIAISPQFSAVRQQVPFETRWKRERRKLKFPAVGSSPVASQYVFYDPAHPIDARHVALFSAQSPVIPVPVRHGGHPVGSVLAECGLLKSAIRECLSGKLDVPALLTNLRQTRRNSSQFLWALADALSDAHLPTKLRLLELSVAALRTDHSLRRLAMAHFRLGDVDRAEEFLREALATPTLDIRCWIDLIDLLNVSTRYMEAAEILAMLKQRYPGNPLVRERLTRQAFRRLGLQRPYFAAKALWLGNRRPASP